MVDPETTFGAVSDIDDTVMVTALPRPLLAAWHTFVVNEHARATTEWDAGPLRATQHRHPGAPLIYLSTGAWNVAPTLTAFSRNLYPAGALLLTDWGPTADRWFRSGREHKRSSLERLAGEFLRSVAADRDDGQHDESIYGEFVKEHPDNVAAVCIRQFTPARPCLRQQFPRPPHHGDPTVPWLYASDGAGLADQLERIGLPRSQHHSNQRSRRATQGATGPEEVDLPMRSQLVIGGRITDAGGKEGAEMPTTHTEMKTNVASRDGTEIAYRTSGADRRSWLSKGTRRPMRWRPKSYLKLRHSSCYRPARPSASGRRSGVLVGMGVRRRRGRVDCNCATSAKVRIDVLSSR